MNADPTNTTEAIYENLRACDYSDELLDGEVRVLARSALVADRQALADAGFVIINRIYEPKTDCIIPIATISDELTGDWSQTFDLRQPELFASSLTAYRAQSDIASKSLEEVFSKFVTFGVMTQSEFESLPEQ